MLEEGEGSCLVEVFPEGVMEKREKLAGLENEGKRLLDWQDVLQVLDLESLHCIGQLIASASIA